MGSEAETEASSTPKLPLSSVPSNLSPEPSGMLTPPLKTSASIPFLWEEEPGKPRPCRALITLPIPTTKCLELPPRLQHTECSRLVTKTPSPTTVLDGPYAAKSVFSSLSFRFNSKRQDSFDSRSSKSPETVQIGALFLDQRKSGPKGKGLFGSWGQKQKNLNVQGREQELAGEGTFVFSPSSMDALSPGDESDSTGTEVKMAKKIRRNGSFPSLYHAKSNFLAAMYEGFKHAIPWKSKKKSTKEALMI